MQTLTYQPNLSFEYKESKLKKHILIGTTILCIILLICLPYLKLKTNILKLQSELEKSTLLYDQQVAAVDSKPLNLDILKKEIDTLNDESRQLALENYKIDINLFQTLENILPTNVWLTEFEFNINTFSIKGRTKSLTSLDILLADLSKIDTQQKLQLITTHTEDIYDFEIKNIKLTN